MSFIIFINSFISLYLLFIFTIFGFNYDFYFLKPKDNNKEKNHTNLIKNTDTIIFI